MGRERGMRSQWSSNIFLRKQTKNFITRERDEGVEMQKGMDKSAVLEERSECD